MGAGATFKAIIAAEPPPEDEASKRSPAAPGSSWPEREAESGEPLAGGARGQVLIAEDDAVVRGRAAQTLADLGYHVTAVSSGQAALEVVTANTDVDLLITDVVMPDGMNGWELAERARAAHPRLKVLLTSGFTAQIAAFQLNKFPHVLAKPYHRSQFEHAVAAAMAPTKVEFVGSYGGAYVYVIDNDSEQRRATVRQLSAAGFTPRPYLTLDDFLADGPRHRPGVVLLETRSFEPDWRRVTAALGDRIVELPVVITSDHADIATAVGAIKAGASDVIERPLLEERLLKSLDALFLGLGRQVPARDLATRARRQLAQLTARQADVLQGLLEGLSNKELAYRLKVSARTVEMHRAKMMDRLGVKTLPEALRLAFEARDPPES